MSEIKKVYFAHIENEQTDETANIIIDTINKGDIKDNFVIIDKEKYFTKTFYHKNKYFIKFYKLRNDVPIILKDTGEDQELDIPEGAIAELSYFYIFNQYIAILRTGYSPNIHKFLKYIRTLYLVKNNIDEINKKLKNDFNEIYNKEIAEKIKALKLNKFMFKISTISDGLPINDEIDDFFTTSINNAIKQNIYSLSIGMETENSFSNKIKNSILKLMPFLSSGKVTLIENNKNIEYNLVHHKIQYSYTLKKGDTVHLNYDDILLKATEWFLNFIGKKDVIG